MAGGLTLGVDWEALGGEASAAVDATHAILVTGVDPVAAARVAVGLGRVQSRTRRVAIGDLVGDVEPLQRLVTGDDPHGIVDSFLYGVSLNKIARQVDDAGMLFVMPSGTEPTVTPDIMSNERWSRLATGFREVGALLVLVAPSDAEGVDVLASMMDGVVVVGDVASALTMPRNSVLAHVDAPTVATAAAAPAPIEMAPVAPAAASAPARQPSATVPPTGAQARTTEPSASKPAAVPAKSGLRKVALILAALVALIATWFVLGRPGLPSTAPAASAVSDSTGADDEGVVEDTVLPPAAAAEPSPDDVAAVRISNPGDSARSMPFSVQLLATNDEAQALARWAALGIRLPAGTVTMVRIRGEQGRVFQVQAGAFETQPQADSMLAALRGNRGVPDRTGLVQRTPFALQLDAGISRQAARTLTDEYRKRQIAAYALLQPDNRATIYVGAFETPQQSAPLMNELQLKGVRVTLHYRTGRSF